MSAGDVITLKEAALILGKGVDAVRDMIYAGRLPAVRLKSGRRPPLVVLRKDVERLRALLDAEKHLRRHERVRRPPKQRLRIKRTVPVDPRLEVPEAARVRREANRLLAQIKQQKGGD